MNQRDELTHELISAYWDGELSSDEHARVEQLLASSDVHRQTLEEIESLGGGMQMLPTYRLDDRFPQRVLELARQADPTIAASTVAWAGPAGMRRWQVGISLALAAAAAVLIALFLRVGKNGGGAGDLPNTRSIAKSNLKQPDVSRPPEPVGPGADERMSDVAVQPAADEPAADPAKSATVPQDGKVSPDVMANARQAVPGSELVESTPPAPAAEPEAVPGEPAAMVTDSQNPAVPPISAAVAGADTPAAPASAVSTGSRVEPAPDAPTATAVPLMGTQKMLLVIDVELTRSGAEGGSFERALTAFGIAFDTNIDVKPDLENALLKSRFFEPAKELQNPAGKSPLQLVYVATHGGAIENLWQHMKQNEAQFARVRMDLAIKPGDMAIFQQLQQLAVFPAMPVANPSESPSARRGTVAHRLVLPASWNGAAVAAAPTAGGGLAGLLPDVPPSPQPPPDMAGGMADGLTPGLDGGMSPGLLGGNIYTEALLVVRTAGEK